VNPITDEELAELALAADPDAPLADDAVPFQSVIAGGDSLLPEWYMPAVSGPLRRGWRARVCVSLALGLVVINACGICVTNGWAELPWLH
jgi:hypothetical protein